MNYVIKKLNGENLEIAKNAFALFKKVFADESLGLPPDVYLKKILNDKHFCILVALKEKQVVGGVTGYELPMYMNKEKEMYLYDLAVDENYRRQGIAGSLIKELKRYSRENNIKTIFVEAEKKDRGAVNFYKSLGVEQLKVEHFNIKID